MEAERPPDESYVDDTVVLDALGDHPKTRILCVFLMEHEQELMIDDLSELTEIERSTLTEQIDVLVDYGLLTIRHTDDGCRYALNTESRAVKALGRFRWRLLDALNENGNPDSRVEHEE